MVAVFYFLAGFGLLIYLVQVLAVRSVIKAHNKKSEYLPPISVLKPLKGLDDNLFENLESFCNQDYPVYEIILAMREISDPAYKVAVKIKEKYKDRDITVVTQWCEEGLNPKVNNLIPAYRASKYDIFLISDSNVLADKDYLRDTIKHMEDGEVGLVSNLIRGKGGRTIGSVFENLHLNTFILCGVCFLEKILKMPCVVGKSMLIRKSHFEEIGGFGAVKEHLAEDYIIGRKMKEAGFKVALSNHAINTVNVYWQTGQFMSRHARWGKLRYRIGGVSYLAELLGNFVFISFIPLLFRGPSRFTLLLPLSAWLLKSGGDYLTGRMLKSDMHPFLYLFSPMKDIIIGIVWFVPIFSNSIEWRGDRYTIAKDSLLHPCKL
jgi:ceramide glucosyltransferase